MLAMANLSAEEKLVHDVCNVAAQAAGDGPGWSNRYLASIEVQGFEIIPMDECAHMNRHGTIDSPIPYPGERSAYPFPSIIAPKGGGLEMSIVIAGFLLVVAGLFGMAGAETTQGILTVFAGLAVIMGAWR